MGIPQEDEKVDLVLNDVTTTLPIPPQISHFVEVATKIVMGAALIYFSFEELSTELVSYHKHQKSARTPKPAEV